MMRKIPERQKQYFADLSKVTTVSEVAQLYYVSTWTVRRLCNEGRIIGTQPGNCGTWVISLASVIDYFGMPKNLSSCTDTLRNFS